MNDQYIYIKLSVMMGDFVITKYYSSTAKFLYCPSLCSKTPPIAILQPWVRLGMYWDADLTSLDFTWLQNSLTTYLSSSRITGFTFEISPWHIDQSQYFDWLILWGNSSPWPRSQWQNSTSSSFCCSVNFLIVFKFMGNLQIQSY